jgi:diaminopimelate decarboxylase
MSMLDCSDLSTVMRELARLPTPALAYDRAGIGDELDRLLSHMWRAVNGRLRCGIRFSIKAHAFPALLSWLAELGVGVEVSSMPEFHAALAAGVESISATSPGFSASDIVDLLEHGVELNLDNTAQLASVPTGTAVGLRLCTQLERPAAQRSDSYSRFGVVPDSSALQAQLQAGRHEVVRLHAHKRDLGRAEQLVSLLSQLSAARAVFPAVMTFNLGGCMTRLQREPGEAERAWSQCARLFRDLPDGAQVLVEPGAQLLTSHRYMATRVLSCSSRAGGGRLAVVDASCWNLVRGSTLELIHPTQSTYGPLTELVGPTCYENDVWHAGVRLGALQPGQLLVFRGVGAYVASMARALHALPIPQQLLL